jgi:hypothetical protein
VCLRLSPRCIFSCKNDAEHQNVIKIRLNETVFTIYATLVPILKINDETDDVAIRVVAAGNVDWPAPLIE